MKKSSKSASQALYILGVLVFAALIGLGVVISRSTKSSTANSTYTLPTTENKTNSTKKTSLNPQRVESSAVVLTGEKVTIHTPLSWTKITDDPMFDYILKSRSTARVTIDVLDQSNETNPDDCSGCKLTAAADTISFNGKTFYLVGEIADSKTHILYMSSCKDAICLPELPETNHKAHIAIAFGDTKATTEQLDSTNYAEALSVVRSLAVQ